MRNFLLTSTVLAGALAASSAFAQTADQPISTAPAADSQQAAELGEIVVTGSRIRRDATNAPTPLIQVSRDELLSTGQTTVIDYLSTLSLIHI